MSLYLDCTVTRGDFTLSIAALIEPGTVVAILGPNGAGKSTLVRAIAGLHPIATGSISINGRVVDDGGATLASAQRRSVGVVFQDYALFPHLNVLDNVAFGPRSRGTGRSKSSRLRTARVVVSKASVCSRSNCMPLVPSYVQACAFFFCLQAWSSGSV